MEEKKTSKKINSDKEYNCVCLSLSETSNPTKKSILLQDLKDKKK
jgi:hypothetical protein